MAREGLWKAGWINLHFRVCLSLLLRVPCKPRGSFGAVLDLVWELRISATPRRIFGRDSLERHMDEEEQGMGSHRASLGKKEMENTLFF